MGVNPLHTVVRLFVNTFGITQPTPESEGKAGRIILLMLLGVAAFVGGVAWMLHNALSH